MARDVASGALSLAVGLVARASDPAGFIAPPGIDAMAPNVQRFYKLRGVLNWGFFVLKAGIAAGIVAFAIDTWIGVTALDTGPGRASASGTAFLVGGISLVAQLIAMELAMDGNTFVGAPDPEAFPDLAQKSANEWIWFVMAFVAMVVGGFVGALISLPDAMLRFHVGPTATPYGPTPGVLTTAILWCASGLVASLLIAGGLRELLAPYLGEKANRRWPLFLTLVIAASAVSSALTFYGIYNLGGNNPAGLGAPISIAALVVLWMQVADANAALMARPEPAPAWPPPPMPTGLPVAMLVGAAPAAAPPTYTPGPYAVGTPPVAAPNFCPLCGSPEIMIASPPARHIRCNACGRDSAY